MNDSDPIVDEVRRVRDAHAARFNYDLRAIFKDIKEQQIRSGLKFVSFARDGSAIPSSPEMEVEPNKAQQPAEAAITASDQIKPLSAAPAAEL
jgi:hypothetical protein